MEKDKQFYWLKLKRDFFKRHDIQIIEDMPNGKDYVLFYLKLLVESVDHNGQLRFSDTIPYNEKMLSVITNTNIDIVKSAMGLFINLGLMETLSDQTIYMNEIEKMTGSETYWAERKRIERKEILEIGQCPTDVQLMSNESPTCPSKSKRQSKSKILEKDNNNTCAFFDNFWSAYPKKVDKEKAQRLFIKLKVDQELFDLMIKAIESQKKSKQWSDKQFIPMPTTWLNNRRWEAELGEAAQEESTGTSGRYLRDNGDGTFTACTR